MQLHYNKDHLMSRKKEFIFIEIFRLLDYYPYNASSHFQLHYPLILFCYRGAICL